MAGLCNLTTNLENKGDLGTGWKNLGTDKEPLRDKGTLKQGLENTGILEQDGRTQEQR
jgi:hypothetical protein